MKKKTIILAISLFYIFTSGFSTLAESSQEARVPIYYNYKNSFCYAGSTAPDLVSIHNYYISGVYWSGAVYKGDWVSSYTQGNVTYNCYMYAGELHSNS
ncbi:hypothetical protein [Anaerorhabdus furcosa]|uniref:Bacteriocin (Lactococcin_972) n=1 Tax=Anaerorhabdus furcosa TaxID=118967 RepID=A0A1T4K395_9FIRM|nr:hypothetical protein [Anaerorhabdus furcosa]SJZ36767.1 hypothetical protein SAMN02745191_0266 [Anaerorhabdus furcosa]